MDIGNIFITIGVILLPVIGCWLGMFAIRYSIHRMKPSKKKTEALKIFTSSFAFLCAILWTVISSGLGYAAYRVIDCLRAAENGVVNGTAIAALVLYLVQLILYWSWMPLFIMFDPCFGVCYESY